MKKTHFFREAAIALCLSLSMFMADAKPSTVVWEQPYYAKGRWWDFRITRIEFSAEETIVTTEFGRRRGSTYSFDSTTMLIADSVHYALRSIDELAIGQEDTIRTSGPAIAHLHFAPVPNDAKKVDFYSKDSFRVWGLQDPKCGNLPLFPSNWRDTKTGDWVLGLMPECAIYANKFWDYVERDEKADDQCTLRLQCEGEELTVTIGQEDKNNVRRIQIGQQKAITCNRILGQMLDDYPLADTRTKFVDNGYRSDTIVVRGWLRSMSKDQWKKSTQINALIYDFFREGRENKYTADLDSLGRFTLCIPMRNSTEMHMDWPRTCLSTVLEPGHEYLVLVDNNNAQTLFMGDDCRLQNELNGLKLFNICKLTPSRKVKKEEIENYLELAQKELAENQKALDAAFKKRPSLSTRTRLYMTGMLDSYTMFYISQSRFQKSDFSLSTEVKDYLWKNYWTKMQKPYTLHRENRTFINDFIDVMDDCPRHIREADLVEKGFLPQLTDDEMEIVNWNKKIHDDCPYEFTAKNVSKINEWWQQQDPEKKHRLAKFNNKYSAEIKVGKKKLKDLYYNEMLQKVGGPNDLIDLCRLWNFSSNAERDVSLYDDGTFDETLAKIQTPDIREIMQGLRDKHEALAKAGTTAFISTGALADEKSGEGLLNKITEPYRGRWILLDIWGMWCSPCKEGIRHSKEEFERFADLNLMYLYLANRSDQASMEAFLKDCGVTGENCACYNLPEAQQSRIENFLSVGSFPSYFLIDPQGRVLEKRVDPRSRYEEIIQIVKGARK